MVRLWAPQRVSKGAAALRRIDKVNDKEAEMGHSGKLRTSNDTERTV